MTAKKKVSLLKRIWDGLFKSNRPVYLEDRNAASQKAKRRHKQAAKPHHKPVKKAKADQAAPSELSADQPVFWGYVDAKGHVRLKANDLILGKSNRSKKAALAEFAKRYASQEQRLERLEALGADAALERENWQALEALVDEVKRRPGLGDLARLMGRLETLQQAFDAASQSLKSQRQAMLEELSALNQQAKIADVSTELDALEARWQTLVETGTPEEAPLVLRFERSAKAIRQLQDQVESKQDALAEEGEALLETLEAQIEVSAWQTAIGLLEKQAARRGLIERALGEGMRKRFADLEAVIRANAAEAEAKQAEARQTLDAKRNALLDSLGQLVETQGWRDEPSAFAHIKRDWQDLAADTALNNPAQDLRFAQLSAELQDAMQQERSARAERRHEAAQSRQDLLETLQGWSKQARSAKDAKAWTEVDEGVAAVRQAWDQQAAAASSAEQQALSAVLETLNQARHDYYQKLSEGRQQALEKKRILIDDVTKFSAAFSSKELRQHLSESLDAWKAAGSAGREHEDDLWEAYNAARDTVRQEIERLRGVEAGEAAERLSAAFAAKKERQAQLENLIMVDELLHESKPSKSLQKQIEKKHGQVRELQDQMMDIQRRLRDLSRKNAAAEPDSEPEAATDAGEQAEAG